MHTKHDPVTPEATSMDTNVLRNTRLQINEIDLGSEPWYQKMDDEAQKTNVIQAGREVRVIVTPEKIDDAAATALAGDIARRIEAELQYPGQIRVVVIRETRSVGVAR